MWVTDRCSFYKSLDFSECFCKNTRKFSLSFVLSGEFFFSILLAQCKPFQSEDFLPFFFNSRIFLSLLQIFLYSTYFSSVWICVLLISALPFPVSIWFPRIFSLCKKIFKLCLRCTLREFQTLSSSSQICSLDLFIVQVNLFIFFSLTHYFFDSQTNFLLLLPFFNSSLISLRTFRMFILKTYSVWSIDSLV